MGYFKNVLNLKNVIVENRSSIVSLLKFLSRDVVRTILADIFREYSTFYGLF